MGEMIMSTPPGLGYVTLGAEDHAGAQAFYDAALAPLGLRRCPTPGRRWS